jgi:hypothetical protein
MKNEKCRMKKVPPKRHLHAPSLGEFMRTTLQLPDTLVNEAMSLTRISTKTELIKFALENVIQREKINELSNYFGKINLDIDLDKLRNR